MKIIEIHTTFANFFTFSSLLGLLLKWLFLRKKCIDVPDKETLRSLMRLKDKDKQLLQMLFSPLVTSEKKAAFFKDLDIDNEPMEFNLMLAHFCSRHGYQNIPTAITPRIRGVARFYLFKNARLFSSFKPLAQIFNQAGIPLLMLKGAAIKACYDPNSCRCLVDIDFAVPKEHFDESVKIAETQGFNIIQKGFHAVNMKQCESAGAGGSIDIHQNLFKTSNKRNFHDELADGAKLTRFFGTEIWVPSQENLLLQVLENEFYNLYSISNPRRHFKWINDCGLILSASIRFDWARLENTAKEYGIYGAIHTMLSLLADYIPQHVPKAVLVGNSSSPFSGNLNEMQNLVHINLDRYVKSLRREKLRSAGKNWQALFLWPSYILAEYRMLRHNGKVSHFSMFMLHHCKAKNFGGVITWLLSKLRSWDYKKKGIKISDSS